MNKLDDIEVLFLQPYYERKSHDANDEETFPWPIISTFPSGSKKCKNTWKIYMYLHCRSRTSYILKLELEFKRNVYIKSESSWFEMICNLAVSCTSQKNKALNSILT